MTLVPGDPGEDALTKPLQPHKPLASRQIEVISWIARGYTKKEVAERMSISPQTVSAHLYLIAAKFGGHFDKVAATHYAIQEGLIQVGEYRNGAGMQPRRGK